MTCEEFSVAGIDLGIAEMDGPMQQAARKHMSKCSHCAALYENWLALREDLRALGAETSAAEAPSRVEMRLRQEFRTRHRTVKTRRTAVILGWSLAAAAALFLIVASVNWRRHHDENLAGNQTHVQKAIAQQDSHMLPSEGASATSDPGTVLMASNSGDFTLLPDSMPPLPEDATVVRVEMQRAALGAFGLTVNEEHAGDWIQVDLLVGDDGLPQAVRLPESAAGTTN